MDSRIKWDYHALGRAIATNSRSQIADVTSQATASANSLGSGFRTGIYHDHKTGETRGDTAPIYEGNVEIHGIVPVGMVYAANYSAMRDTLENNTLLKAVPHV